MTFNHRDRLLNSIEVRQALQLAVDRQQILKRVFGGEGALANSILSPEHWAAASTLTIPDYNPALASTLLDEAGLRDTDGDGWRELQNDENPWQLSIRVQTNNLAEENIAFFIADAYRQIGIQARAEPVRFNTLLDDLLTYDYQIIVYHLPLLAKLDYRTQWHSEQIEATFGANLAAYANPQVDSWLEEANQISGCFAAERADIYQKIQTQLAEDHPFDFLIIPTQFMIVAEEIKGISPGPFAPFTWNGGLWQLYQD